MDLIPKPDQVVSAAANLAHKVLHGLAGLRRTTCPIIDELLANFVGERKPSRETLGSNPSRRYGSASSRSLAGRT